MLRVVWVAKKSFLIIAATAKGCLFSKRGMVNAWFDFVVVHFQVSLIREWYYYFFTLAEVLWAVQDTAEAARKRHPSPALQQGQPLPLTREFLRSLCQLPVEPFFYISSLPREFSYSCIVLFFVFLITCSVSNCRRIWIKGLSRSDPEFFELAKAGIILLDNVPVNNSWQKLYWDKSCCFIWYNFHNISIWPGIIAGSRII
jgi:hypothetical protein